VIWTTDAAAHESLVGTKRALAKTPTSVKWHKAAVQPSP
jgi:hypothetical protein